MSKTIDFSEFFKNPRTLTENVKDHFEFLQREGLGDYEVVTFQSRSLFDFLQREGLEDCGVVTFQGRVLFRIVTRYFITALKALIPAEGNRTIKEVILPYPDTIQLDDEGERIYLSPAGDDLDLGHGILEIGCLHLGNGSNHHDTTLTLDFQLLGSLNSIAMLKQNIKVQEIVMEVICDGKLSSDDQAFIDELFRDVSLFEWIGRKKICLICFSKSDQSRVKCCLEQGKPSVFNLSLSDGPQCIPSFSPPNSTSCHSAFVEPKQQVYSHEKDTTIHNTELQHLNFEQIYNKGAKGQGVAVAVLSSGCDYDLPGIGEHVVGKWNFTNQYTPVFECGGIGSYLSRAVVAIAPESKLIVCKTSISNDYKVDTPNGVTATAFKWLREKWSDKDWKEEHGLHSLVVLIPYGGHYREDEMIAINEAIDDGIIVVCAAGDTLVRGAGITFPASMGNVICVGAADESGRPGLSSPPGREIDCLALHQLLFRPRPFDTPIRFEGTGASATVLAGFVALLMSYIHTLFKDDRYPPEINHVSIIREVLQQTTLHNSQGGYGWIMPDVFRFSKEKIKRLLNAITNERKLQEPPDSASSKERCQFNTKVLSNRNLNKELDLGVILSGCAVRIAVIDDDFPEALKTTHKGSSLEYIMQSPSFMFENHVELLRETTCSLKQVARSLASPMKQTGEEQARSLEREAGNFTELCEQVISEDGVLLKEQHGLQCALIIANILPEVELRLVNATGADSECESFAKTILNLVSMDPTERPHIIVSSMGFDQFNSHLAKAVNAAINIGIIPVFSAGNIGHMETNSIAYPSRLGNALCIGAHSPYGQAQEFSSVGREINFLAPGEFMILDRCPVSGTSFSAPAAAAFIALILEYVDKIQNGTEGVSDQKYKSVKVWKNDQWEDVPINEACRNVYVMRELLCQLSLHRNGHAQSTGYGNLDIRRLHNIRPEDIHDIVQNFHKPT